MTTLEAITTITTWIGTCLISYNIGVLITNIKKERVTKLLENSVSTLKNLSKCINADNEYIKDILQENDRLHSYINNNSMTKTELEQEAIEEARIEEDKYEESKDITL